MKKILVVDDEPNVVKAIGVALEFAGYERVAFGTGNDAIDYVNGGGPYDLALVDHELDEGTLSGQDTMKRLKELYPNRPVVSITGADLNDTPPYADGWLKKGAPDAYDALMNSISSRIG